MSQPLARSARHTEFWDSNTPESVGPGSYECLSSSPPRPAVRVPGPIKPRRLWPSRPGPGPGAYTWTQANKTSHSVKGSNSFVSGRSRMAPLAPGVTTEAYPSSFQTPGPGSYDLQSTKRDITRGRRRLPGTVRSTPASIPAAKVSNLQAEPASYHPSWDLTKPKAGSSYFAASKDVRRLWEPTNSHGNHYPSPSIPGPGTYHKEKTLKAARGNATFLSRVPLLHAQKERNELPGPGTYDPPQHSGITHELVSFGSKSERGEVWAFDLELPYTRPERAKVPGVGSYEAQLRPRRQHSEAPFSVTETRDCLAEVKEDLRPGPGSYTPDFTLRRKSNSKARRLQDRFKNGLFEPKPGPPPGAYFQPKEPYQSKVSDPSFKSASERFKLEERDLSTDFPSVGAYDLKSEWTSPLRKRPNVSFDSSARRFRPEEPFPGTQKSATPGPGMYQNAETGMKQAAVVLQSRRFEEPKAAREAAPGQYHLEQSLVKRSFNFTIQPPKEKPRLWTFV